LKNDRTDEIIAGVDHQMGAGFAAGINYVWRRYTNFQFYDVVGIEPSDYTAVQFTAPASTCLGSLNARCPTVTYYVPGFQVPSVTNLTNFSTDQFNRAFNGVEITGRKRMSHHWLMNTSFAYNSTIVNNGYAGAAANTVSEDPTNKAMRDGYQYDYATTGSGLDNVYVNSKWLFKVSGLYNLPYDFNVSGFYNTRQGYPFEAIVRQASRPNGAGTADVLLDGVGDNRLPNFQNLDLHVDRPIKVGTVRFTPSVDLFNIFNFNTVQALRRIQNATNANQISATVAPFVARFGVRVIW